MSPEADFEPTLIGRFPHRVAWLALANLVPVDQVIHAAPPATLTSTLSLLRALAVRSLPGSRELETVRSGVEKGRAGGGTKRAAWG